MSFSLQLCVSRHEADVDGFFLANRAGATLGTAVARADTDLHISGNSTSFSTLLTSEEQVIVLHLPSSCTAAPGGVRIPSNLRINTTTSRIGLAIDGSIATTLSGQGSIKMSELVSASQKNRSASMQVTYADWKNIGAYMLFSGAKFVNNKSDMEVFPIIEDDVSTATRLNESEEILTKLYETSSHLRSNVVVYEPAPPLSKPVMRTPVGINSSSYDLSCNVVDRPPSLTGESFESLAKACIDLELDTDASRIGAFLSDTTQPSFEASRWAENVANAMSTLVCYTMPYRVDGAATVLPTGLSMVSAELWKSEAQRDCMTSDDCDGSAAEITSSFYAADDVARDPELSKRFPYTAAISNSMAHHVVGLSVLSANAGNADAAGKDGHSAIAGHAIAIAIPKPMMLNGQIVAIHSSSGFGRSITQDQKNFIDSVKLPYLQALYHDGDLSRMPVGEQEKICDGDYMSGQVLNENKGLIPLAMEGTSPVACAKLYEFDTPTRLKQIELMRLEKELSTSIGPSLARTVSRLHVPSSSHGPTHSFYKDFVEFLVPARKSMGFKSPKLRERGLATSHYVFAKADNVRSAGVAALDLASGNFSMVPLWKVNTSTGETLDIAHAESMQHTMPMRGKPTQLDEWETKIYKTNLKLCENLAIAKPLSAHVQTLTGLRQIISFAAMARNENGISHLTKLLSTDAAVQGVKLRVLEVNGIMTDCNNTDVGAVVELTVFG